MIILWQLEQIRGFTTLTNLRPTGESAAPSSKKTKNEGSPIVTFDFPKSFPLNKPISLVLCLKNTFAEGIVVEVLLMAHADYIWVGKTKHLCAIDPDQVARVKLNAVAAQKGFVDLNSFALQWRFESDEQPRGQLKVADQLIVEVSK
jgi:hypothetical protein